jgi:hypothetical protein
MKVHEVLEAAQQVGMVVEHQELGYWVYEARGRLIGSQLPIDQVAGLVHGRLKTGPRPFADGARLLGCAFPAS